MTILDVHPGKKKTTESKGVTYTRHMVRTVLFDETTLLGQEIIDSCDGFLQSEDVICIAESVVAITQKRAYKIVDIVPGMTARILSRFVTRTPAGIGLGMPETMQLAVNEVGACRLWFAAGIYAVTKLFGRRGDFYRIAGEKARGIDGPTAGTLPPYNEYATLIPDNPRKIAETLEKELSTKIGVDVQVIIADANDIGVNILGWKNAEQKQLGMDLCCDNPMGQGHEQTPIMICRKLG